MIITGLDIKRFRKKNNLTQGELAELLGISERTVQNYESGGVIPNTKTAIFQKIFMEYEKDDDEVYLEKNGVKVSIEEMTRFILYNEEAFFNDKGFKLWFNDHINTATKRFLEEQGITISYSEKKGE